MLSPDQDAFGQMLVTNLRGAQEFEIVERDDGYINTGGGHALYFSTYESWSPVEQQALTYVRGRVLDIGSGAGRHALYLQMQGHDVTATDNSPLAVRVCRERGVHDARIIPITRLSRAVGIYDTLTLLGGNLGLVGNFERARWLLRRFYHMTSAQGRIIASTQNPYGTTEPAHLRYHEQNRQRGRMAGQVRIRFRFHQYIGTWLELLLVSPDELRGITDGTGWQVAHLLGNPDGMYITILDKVL
jgi:SAM-dependent methyltransferase